MRRALATAVAATALATAAPADALVVFAAADVICQGAVVTDTTREAGWQIGVVNGAVVKSEPGTLTCAIYINGGRTWSAAGHTSGTSLVQVAQVNSVSNYPATAADSVTLCALFTFDNGGHTEWWRPGLAPGTGSWQPAPVDPSACQRLAVNPNPAGCSVLNAVDPRLGTDLAESWQDCDPYPPIV